MSEPIEHKLVVNTESWHFKYFKFIRGIWGMDVPERTSLCPYCQTIFWFSVGTVALFPVIVIGYLIFRFMRLTYKSAVNLQLNFLVDLMDKLDITDNIGRAPASVTMFTAFVSLTVLALAAGVVFLVVVVVAMIIAHVGDAPSFFSWLFTSIGWLVFMSMSILGGALHAVWGSAYGVATNYAMWAAIGSWDLLVLEFSVGAFAFCFLTYLFAETRVGAALFGMIATKINGFGEARSKTKARRDEEEEYRKRLAEPYEEDPKPGIISKIWDFFCGKTVYLGKGVGKGFAHSLGVFTILWEYVKAVKRNVCPIVDFVSGPPGGKAAFKRR